MKKIVLALFAVISLSATGIHAQAPAVQPRSISVAGTAELEIVPDEIYVSATLAEFTKDKKKYLIEDLEKGMVGFIETVTKTQKNDIRMDDMDASVIALKRKSKDAVISKSYEIKFKDQKQVAQFFASIDSLNVRNVYVLRYSHSKMDEYKKQIKINAIKAAKEKADYLLEAIGSKTGKPLQISEPSGFVSIDDGSDFRPFRGNVYQSRMLENNISQSYGGEEDVPAVSTVGGKKIKLSYTINAQFEIQ